MERRLFDADTHRRFTTIEGYGFVYYYTLANDTLERSARESLYIEKASMAVGADPPPGLPSEERGRPSSARYTTSLLCRASSSFCVMRSAYLSSVLSRPCS